MSGPGAVDDPDSCIPGPVRDFVFDLHDSARRSYVESEQISLYNGTFRELSSKYFATSAWPSADSLANECGGDPIFLAFYNEFTSRHLHSVTRPQVKDRIDGWHVYRCLFDIILSEAPPIPNASSDANSKDAPSYDKPGLYILPEWAFDILHEFVYQFQGFCQFRTQTVANASKYSNGGTMPTHLSETIETLSRNRDAWAVETVLFYLHRLVPFSSIDVTPSSSNDGHSIKNYGAYRHLGIFASVVLSRLECLLGDYRESLAALIPTYSNTTSPGNNPPALAVVGNVFQAKLSLAYHSGVSLLMLRRYKDAAKILGNICITMQRGFKTGQLRKLSGSDQFMKLFERMIAILAILVHICPTSASILENDAILRVIRDKHGSQLSKIEGGEEGYEDLFIFACPKFISPSVPDYESILQSAAGGGSEDLSSAISSSAQDAYRLQVKQFMTEMSLQRSLQKLRSYLKLYTSINVDKLAAFNDTPPEDFLARLLCYKHKLMQVECGNALINSSSVGIVKDEEDKAMQYGEKQVPLEGVIKSAMDIHYHIVGDMVHISDDSSSSNEGEKNKEKQVQLEQFFMKQILQCEEILQDIEAIDTNV